MYEINAVGLERCFFFLHQVFPGLPSLRKNFFLSLSLARSTNTPYKVIVCRNYLPTYLPTACAYNIIMLSRTDPFNTTIAAAAVGNRLPSTTRQDTGQGPVAGVVVCVVVYVHVVCVCAYINEEMYDYNYYHYYYYRHHRPHKSMAQNRLRRRRVF